MTADLVRTWLDAHTQAAEDLAAEAMRLGHPGAPLELARVLDRLRDEAFACGYLSADLVRLSSH